MSVSRYTDVFKIDAKGVVKTNAGAIVVPAYVARTGVQEYMDACGRVRREYRPDSEVFSDSSLASYEGVALTVRHPPEQYVDACTWKKYSVGHVISARRSDNKVEARLMIADRDAAEQVLAGKLVELSAGYTADVVEERTDQYDFIQKNININHVALLEQGQARGGRELRVRLDSQGNAVLDNGDEVSMDKEKDSAHVDTKEEPTVDERDVRIDALQAENDELRRKLESYIPRDEVAKIVARRLEIVEKAKKVSPETKMDGLSEREAMVAVLRAVGETVANDATDDYIAGAFAVLKPQPKVDAVAAIAIPQPDVSDPVGPSKTDEYYSRQWDAWRFGGKK